MVFVPGVGFGCEPVFGARLRPACDARCDSASLDCPLVDVSACLVFRLGGACTPSRLVVQVWRPGDGAQNAPSEKSLGVGKQLGFSDRHSFGDAPATCVRSDEPSLHAGPRMDSATVGVVGESASG